jgi:spore coat polysaccharide biosynthesis protein SpsF (cytidylyltransferase family)
MQARTSSSRLPAKVLLPVAGMPLIVLAVKRAANIGMDVRVVTSDDESDDYLCSILKEESIPYYRGSLNNVLKRFVLSLQDIEDDRIIIRLTGDNLVPDGSFLKEMVNEFEKKSLNYLSSNGDGTGLPYGLSVEIMKLQYLREAYESTKLDSDLEHVTGYIKRKFGISLYMNYSNLKLENKRCTIDTLDDFLYMVKIINTIPNPIYEPALKIINKLI